MLNKRWRMITMSNLRKKSQGILMVMTYLLVACSSLRTTPTPSISSSPNASSTTSLLITPSATVQGSSVASTSTHIPSATSAPQASPTPHTPNSYLESLSQGVYIVYSAWSGKKADGSNLYSLYAISPDGKIQARLTIGAVSTYKPAISPDQRQIVFADGFVPETKLFQFDLMNNIIREIPTGAGCDQVTWSPDGATLALVCNFQLYVLPIASSSEAKLATNGDDTRWHISYPAWSPNGKWIAFLNGPTGSPGRVNPTDGIYLMDASCLSELVTCQPKLRGPLTSPSLYYLGPLDWSPDSQSLAVADGQKYIYIVNVTNGQRRVLVEGYQPNGLSWSLDGKQIAFSVDDDIYLISPEEGK